MITRYTRNKQIGGILPSHIIIIILVIFIIFIIIVAGISVGICICQKKKNFTPGAYNF
jgi:hypothetical protein